ncbi:MAG: arylamine N-acetyltransferase [Haliangiales bacterium]
MQLDIDAYLERIGYAGEREPSASALAALQRQHLYQVPFENLDIHFGRRIVLDLEALFDKVVRRRRGGFCYELNGLFAALLRALGYDVTLLSAQVFGDDGALGPEHDHLALAVRCEGRWLVDVGFGEAFLEPLSLMDLASAEPQVQGRAAHQLRLDGDRVVYAARDGEGRYRDQYVFMDKPRALSEFDEMCAYQQDSPESVFTQKRLCTRALPPDGQMTLRDRVLITTTDGERVERPIADVHAWHEALRVHFDIVL